MWQVPAPLEHVAITEGSNALIWPIKKSVNFNIEVQALSAEKLPFILDAVFTVGPRLTDDENLSSPITLVQDIIESKSRVIAASMTTDQIFNGTEEFKKLLLEKLQLELKQFGLVIYKVNVKQLVYTANVKQLVDVAGHEYFSNLGQMLQIEPTNQVKVDLATKKVAWSQSTDLAKVEAAKQVALREAELQLQVEKKKTLVQTEKLRAQLLSKAIVQYEVKVQEANGELYNKEKAAHAVLYENLKKADAQRATADATSYTRQQVGKAVAQAEGEYLAMLVKQFRGDYGAMKDYLMLRPGGLQELPKFSPGAEKGPVPKSAYGQAGKPLRKGGGVGGGKKDGASGSATLSSTLAAMREYALLLSRDVFDSLNDALATD